MLAGGAGGAGVTRAGGWALLFVRTVARPHSWDDAQEATRAAASMGVSNVAVFFMFVLWLVEKGKGIGCHGAEGIGDGDEGHEDEYRIF